MMFGGAGMMGGWMMAAYGAIGLLVFLAGTLAVVVLLRASRSADRTATPTAADVLAQRYARGEIDDDEYLQRQSVLESSQTVRTARGLPGVS